MFTALRVVVRFLLIPLAHALPAVQVYLNAHPDDRSRLTTRQLQELARWATRVIETSELLVIYAVAVGGKPLRN